MTSDGLRRSASTRDYYLPARLQRTRHLTDGLHVSSRSPSSDRSEVNTYTDTRHTSTHTHTQTGEALLSGLEMLNWAREQLAAHPCGRLFEIKWLTGLRGLAPAQRSAARGATQHDASRFPWRASDRFAGVPFLRRPTLALSLALVSLQLSQAPIN